VALRLTQADVQAARDELARRYVADFACSVDIPTVPVSEDPDEERFTELHQPKLASHHALLLRKLQQLGTPAVPNLMVLMPPGSAKSTYVDVVYVPWFMAAKPKRNVILASYASDIAKKQGRRARQLIKTPGFNRIFPSCALRSDQSAADEWALENGSEYMAGGILSGLTGNRGALGVLDDPIKGRQAAESQVIRDTTWDAYTDDFCSRLIPGSPQIMILTRWHSDDPAGRILPEDWDGQSGAFYGRDGRWWEVICLPAIADRDDDPLERAIGETLWPEWFSHEHWAPFQRNTRTWTSLYQQKPTADEGTFFKTDWFKRFSLADRPTALNIYMTSDHAPGGGEKNDFNVFRVWGIDEHQHIWLLDGHRAQATIDVAMGVKLDPLTGQQTLADTGALALIKKWKPLCWFPEADNNWRSVAAFVTASMRMHRVPCRIEPLSTAGGDKATKAQAFQAKAAMGEVHIPIGPMGEEVLDQYRKFPAGKHDDEIDAAANIGRAIDMAHPAIVKVKVVSTNPPDGDYRRRPQPQSSAWG
jgi:hypothetical protein